MSAAASSYYDSPPHLSFWKRIGVVFLILLVLLGLYFWFSPLNLMRNLGKLALLTGGIHGHFAQVGPYRVHYYEGGEGPPLVFVHGLGAEALNWVPAMLAFRHQYHVYAIDLLGHGETERPDITYSIAQQVEMVHQFTADRNAVPADVVGISMGGWITAKLAIDHPDAVKRIVLADAAGMKFQTTLSPDSFLPTNHAEFQTFMRMLTPRVSDAPYPLRRDFLQQVSNNAWITRRIFASILTYQDILDGRLQQIHAPTLVIWGKQENMLPLSLGYAMKDQIPNASMLVCDGTGHLAIYECWTKLKPSVAEFLNSPQPVAPYVREVAIDSALVP